MFLVTLLIGSKKSGLFVFQTEDKAWTFAQALATQYETGEHPATDKRVASGKKQVAFTLPDSGTEASISVSRLHLGTMNTMRRVNAAKAGEDWMFRLAQDHQGRQFLAA